MRQLLLIAAAAFPLAACNQGPSVSLTNASPEEVAKASRDSGVAAEMRPGQWETRIEILKMDMPGLEGMPAQIAEKMKAEMMKPRAVASCMTEADVKQNKSKIFTGDSKCRFEKYQMSGGAMEAVMICPGTQGDMKMQMSGSFAGESFAVNQSMDMNGPTGKMHTEARVSGKRIGDCPAGKS